MLPNSGFGVLEGLFWHLKRGGERRLFCWWVVMAVTLGVKKGEKV